LKKFLSVIAVVLWLAGTRCAADAGEVFPEFSSQTLDGTTVTNAIFAGKKLTMINIWATWCGPCISEMPDLGTLARSMPEGTQLVGILEDAYYDSGAVGEAKTIISRANANFPHILPVDEMMPYLGIVDAIPWTIFVDSDGRIVGDPCIGSHSAAGYRRALEDALDILEGGTGNRDSGGDKGGGCNAGPGVGIMLAVAVSILNRRKKVPDVGDHRSR
jgi:thiol-disulfide isomerase/thioredoxin